VFTFKLFFFVVKQEFSTEASTDLRQTKNKKKKKKEKREKTAQKCSVMHEKKRAQKMTMRLGVLVKYSNNCF
jgi:hypothetical protein